MRYDASQYSCSSEGLATAVGKDLKDTVTVLCKAVKDAQVKDLIPLVRDAKFICEKCGRAAASKKNLCSPKKLGK